MRSNCSLWVLLLAAGALLWLGFATRGPTVVRAAAPSQVFGDCQLVDGVYVPFDEEPCVVRNFRMTRHLDGRPHHCLRVRVRGRFHPRFAERVGTWWIAHPRALMRGECLVNVLPDTYRDDNVADGVSDVVVACPLKAVAHGSDF